MLEITRLSQVQKINRCQISGKLISNLDGDTLNVLCWPSISSSFYDCQ